MSLDPTGGARSGSIPGIWSGLPDGFQQRRLADVFVAGDQCQAFRPRGGANQSVHRIVRVVVWKLGASAAISGVTGFTVTPTGSAIPHACSRQCRATDSTPREKRRANSQTVIQRNGRSRHEAGLFESRVSSRAWTVFRTAPPAKPEREYPGESSQSIPVFQRHDRRLDVSHDLDLVLEAAESIVNLFRQELTWPRAGPFW